MKTGNILVIDDDAEIREIVQVLLSSEGYTVETVADGMQALTMLTEKTFLPDVIILDIMMPDMDGYSVCKQIREISQVPVLFLTAKNRETDLVEGFLAGGDDYMQKPFSYTELIARVGGLMRRYRQYGGQSDPQKEKQVFISDLVIDKDQVSVTKNGKNVELTNTEIDYIDPVFKEQDAILDESMAFNGLEKRGGALFTDQSINGQTYTLQIKETTAELDETEQRIISIYSLSESYFLYLLSLQKIAGSTLEGGLGNIGLAEPLRVYSNVEGGTGILGGNQHSETTITLNNPSKK